MPAIDYSSTGGSFTFVKYAFLRLHTPSVLTPAVDLSQRLPRRRNLHLTPGNFPGYK
ncbi:hypothetical protein BDM02DRAFT_3114310 [Thelephora ganbajun]|uniref:Uncharacterized protein n=1 Tax=Thelephora ganbajun TaxID=370292 RepID=A0ACB6ZHL8_THEGA|nr:hypothetical protein BDM02DRAFT_3114310 [Thelephora ganbajun]